jgi:hypothetical protein
VYRLWLCVGGNNLGKCLGRGTAIERDDVAMDHATGNVRRSIGPINSFTGHSLPPIAAVVVAAAAVDTADVTNGVDNDDDDDDDGIATLDRRLGTITR